MAHSRQLCQSAVAGLGEKRLRTDSCFGLHRRPSLSFGFLDGLNRVRTCLHSEISQLVQLGAIAEYVDKRPGDTLVNQPTKCDLVIDFMIAKALGLTVPRSRCSAAVIE